MREGSKGLSANQMRGCLTSCSGLKSSGFSMQLRQTMLIEEVQTASLNAA